jgi:hypothetical protein
MTKAGRAGVDRPYDLDDDIMTPIVAGILEKITSEMTFTQR